MRVLDRFLRIIFLLNILLKPNNISTANNNMQREIIIILLTLVIYFIDQNRKKYNILFALTLLVTISKDIKYKHIAKYKHKLQKRTQRQNKHVKRKHPKRNQGDILAVDIYERTGLFEDQFEDLFQSVKDVIQQPRSILGKRKTRTSLTPRFQLLLILHYLRRHLHYSTLQIIYGISKAMVSREIWHIIPKLYLKLDNIQLPTQWIPHQFEGVSAAMDCASHFRMRVHPKQADWYRADKHAFFITAQVIVSLTGSLLSVIFGLGHNNDQSMFNRTEFGTYLAENGLKWLADGGYKNINLITPDKYLPVVWNNEQKKLRSIVEVVIGFVKLYLFAGQRVRVAPELQELGLMVCYQLTQIILREFPIKIQV